MPEVYADDLVTVEWLADVGPYGNSAYIIRPRDESAPVTVIDIPTGFEVVAEAVGDRAVERVIVTHSHIDHTAGWDTMLETLAAPVLVGAEETDLEEGREFDLLADGDEIAIGEATMRVMHTPGHTPGSISLLLGGAVFTGDTLFPGGPGATRSNELLQQEITSITSRLFTLPAETVVLPGHGGGTTIGESIAEYEVFASREHDPDLHGDVLWLES
ncbi:MAG: MBL fold metallo-hydrolase [Chloroflexota bacterium]|nr:MBL fold metallo-hydrolase [Chloroflexota bacterium]